LHFSCLLLLFLFSLFLVFVFMSDVYSWKAPPYNLQLRSVVLEHHISVPPPSPRMRPLTCWNYLFALADPYASPLPSPPPLFGGPL